MLPNKFFIKNLIRYFRGKKFFFSPDTLFSEHTDNYFRSLPLLRLFYGFSLFLALDSFHWMYERYSHKIFFAPLWPFVFFTNDSLIWIFKIAIYAWPLFSLLSFLFVYKQSFRILHALSLFLIFGLTNSDGHFGHNNHAFLWISMVFALIPCAKDHSSRAQKHIVLLGVWGAQFVICTFYFLTGYWKVASLLNCAVNPNLSCQLDHWILTNITAREAIFYNQFAPWRDFFFTYPWISFFSYVATIWIHLASLHFVFRFDLHRVFGVFRLVFHLGTFLFFGVNFSNMAFPVALLFIFSPFGRYKDFKYLLFQLLRLPPASFIFYKWKQP